MLKDEQKIREAVSAILEQSSPDLRLDQDLLKITCRLIMTHDAHVPDTLTRIRVLPTVAVVGQSEPVERQGVSDTTLEIYVKFLPASSNTMKNLKSLGKLIKSLPGVKIVRVVSVAGSPVTYKGKPIVI
tara:strand:+ start:245 stop:631 length:387 start_codon:yes stop_codon:yes gene_type:complete